MTVTILVGDVFERLRVLPDSSVDCVVTSPPYWGLRDYDVAGQIGLEPTLGEHLDVMVAVFAEIWRVLKPTGTVWLNYGDCFATQPNGRAAADVVGDDRTFRDKPFSTVGPIYSPYHAKARGQFTAADRQARIDHGGRIVAGGTLKNKDLCMVANRLAIALQDWGWWVRQEIIWHKPTAMPESAKDRPTTAHEKIWLLSKGERYFYDSAAAREPTTGNSHRRGPKTIGPNSRMNYDRTPGPSRKKVPAGWDTAAGAHGTIHRAPHHGRAAGLGRKSVPAGSGIKANASFNAALVDLVETRNMRSVWTIASGQYAEAHFATFPLELAERCILAGTPKPHGHVLDPFGGSGSVGLVASQLGLRATLIELNPGYAEMAYRRIFGSAEAAE
ncbi:MAG: DNA adenine methylase [Chelatococcus sp.]|nr:MAG: DNA adenine methylase [Chelatococcus sp.]